MNEKYNPYKWCKCTQCQAGRTKRDKLEVHRKYRRAIRRSIKLGTDVDGFKISAPYTD